MHENTKILLDKVNEKLTNTPLIYFSRDIERGLGLENYLTNFHLAAIEDSYIADQLTLNSGDEIFILQKEENNILQNSTLELINHPKTKEWVSKLSKSGNFYAQLFQFNQPAISALSDLGGSVLNNDAALNRKFEDKISQFQIILENGIKIPPSEIIVLEDTSLIEVISNLNIKINHNEAQPLFIAQIARSHTGAGTFFIRKAEDWDQIKKLFLGNVVKLSEYIEGDSYTINGCVTKKGIFVQGLQYQVTGIKELTPGEGSTVGNDFSYASELPEITKSKIRKLTKDIGQILEKDKFRGLFGIDVVVKNGEVYLIEINARQTANIPFQTKLELLQDKVPLSLISLADWLDIEIPFDPEDLIPSLYGAQIFLRAGKDSTIIPVDMKSGIYRLQSDNSARNRHDDDVIYIGNTEDKPLIWQYEGYCVEDIKEGGFVLLFQKKGQRRDKYDEVARIQFLEGIIIWQNGQSVLKPWIFEALNEVKSRFNV